jgi:hypothetical protein
LYVYPILFGVTVEEYFRGSVDFSLFLLLELLESTFEDFFTKAFYMFFESISKLILFFVYYIAYFGKYVVSKLLLSRVNRKGGSIRCF